MKKIAFALALFIVLIGAASAQSTIALGTFPVGTWQDANYGAIWEFSSDNIRILSSSGEVYWDFTAKGIQDFKVVAEASGVGITFSCSEAGLSGKTYKILSSLTSASLTLAITRAGLPLYTVKMPKK
jgi:hypothetical protein